MSTVISDEHARENIATNLRRLLNDRNWSQCYLAERTKEPEMTISRMIRGENLPRAGALARVAEALDVSVDRLIADPPEPPPVPVTKLPGVDTDTLRQVG